MSLKFGTDGVRGVANVDLTPEVVLLFGRAIARVLPSETFVVGRDTRISGPLLQASLSAGIASEGVTVVDAGVLPTPGVAFLSAEKNAPAAVISASHNPFADNGIKVFESGGRKLSNDVEGRLEAELASLVEARGPKAATAAVGGIVVDRGASARYADRVVSTLDGRSLDGLRVVIDCANGAASTIGELVFTNAGAEVTAINANPDGSNINDACGSTHPESLQKAVRDAGADLGLALDGDADRVIAVDGSGGLVDGDHMLALLALDLREHGRLVDDTVVVTVLTNLGFKLAMSEKGVKVVETAVGDRNVLEALEDGGWSLGGEQSGHVIFRDLATTGDGLMTGLLVADLVRRKRAPLAELAGAVMTRLPQVLRSVAVADVSGLETAEAVWSEAAMVERELKGRGRVLIRASGTEPVVRVMVEASTQADANRAAERLVATVERVLATPTS